MTTFWAQRAWLRNGPVDGVRIDVGDTGQIGSVHSGVPPSSLASDAIRLPGMVLPGLANAHSHAFHRALRGRTHSGGGTFWTWRERMYGVAARLDPDSYLRLATAVYAEMALAGITCVGEFHYLHHDADGRPYAEPNVMGEALRAAAAAAGIRLTLLDTCYVAGGIDRPLDGVQRRFGDGDADGWAARVSELRPDRTTRIGAAVHSVRAVPAGQLGTVVAAAAGRPLHAHLSEQPAENEQCLAAYGVTPTRLLGRNAVLGSGTTVVHATHLTDADVAELGATATTACFCPTTERDLADGIGRARRLADAGAPLALGSDQHAVIDLFEEARAVEMHERLSSGSRGRFAPAELVTAATAAGHAALGWPEAGVIEVGAPADFVAVRLDTARTAGSDPAEIVFAATAADVDTVVVGGRMIVAAGAHVLGDVGRLLADAAAALV